MRLCVLVAVALAGAAAPTDDLDRQVQDGWARYRAGDFAGAEQAFSHVLRAGLPLEDAEVGLAYTILQLQGPAAAAARFQAVLSRQPSNEDALRGLVLSGRRAEASPEVRASALAAARALEARRPEDPAVSLDRLALQAAVGGPAERRLRPAAPSSLPLGVPVRAGADYLEVRTADGFEPIFVKGVNLGLALPGRWPTEFPRDAGLYTAWLSEIAALGANAVRAYTLLPPVFYRALAEHNASPGNPRLWLVQGVWTELPEGHDFGRAEAVAAFEAEIARVIDAVHGNLELAPRPGHAAGRYVTDVSDAVLAFVIGREWEPFAVEDYLARRPGRADWRGQWLVVRDGNAMERWVAARCDFAVGHEAMHYRVLHPVTFASWPTLDPLTHPTESDREEEDRWRRRHGLPPFAAVGRPWENDSVSVDAARIEATPAMEAGFFASYHIYPNYPDFLNLEPDFARAPDGRYAAYLRALKAHHRTQPVLVAEFGMATSRGIAHVQPEGLHHGGIPEERQGALDADLLRSIHGARYAGGVVFSWLDEWFKGTWSVARLEVPAERRRLWLNVESPEQNYGLMAARPDSLPLRLDGDDRDWDGARHSSSPLRASQGTEGWAAIQSLRAAADEAYVWLLLRTGGVGVPLDWEAVHFRVALDTYAPERGERVLPAPGPVEVETGVEFLADLGGPRGSRLSVTEPYEPYARLDAGDLVSPSAPAGRFVPLLFESNRERIARDGRRFPAVVVDRGVLREGVDLAVGDGVLELRLPWSLLGVSDPSSHRVLHQAGARGEELGTAVTEGFRLYAFTSDPRQPEAPPMDRHGPVLFRWAGWEEPRYRLEPKPGLPALRDAMHSLEPLR